MPSKTYPFPQAARLKRRKVVDALFRQGKRWHGTQVTVHYLPQTRPGHASHQVLFSVPKRKLKRAVDRNTVKRRLREAYRLHAFNLPATHTSFHLGFVYQGKRATVPSYTDLVQEVVSALRFLAHKYSPKGKSNLAATT